MYIIFCNKCTFKIIEGHLSLRFLAEGRRNTQRVLVLILPSTLHILYIYIYIYIYMLINIGLGHFGWEILPRPMGPGPWAHAAAAWAQGPGALLLHGPGSVGPGKISLPRSPRPILINVLYIHILFPILIPHSSFPILIPVYFLY